MKLPGRQHDLAAKMYAGIKESADNKPRPHLGASLIGHNCRRWLWLSFRWCVQEDFEGRILRLFRRGQDEEARIIEDLRNAGVEVIDDQGSQARVEILPHFSGSMDGIALSGVPEAPKKKHILEFKTHSKKSFDDLIKNGVKKSQPKHYAQMQVYMLGSEIDRALYVAICKDDDRIYTERVRFDDETAQKLKLKAEQIIFTDRLPEPLSTRPDWYECKWCAAYQFCHQKDVSLIKKNCRSCEHSSATNTGFLCHKHNGEIPVEYQYSGCGDYEINKDLKHEAS
jgi:hypothetical protein